MKKKQNLQRTDWTGDLFVQQPRKMTKEEAREYLQYFDCFRIEYQLKETVTNFPMDWIRQVTTQCHYCRKLLGID